MDSILWKIVGMSFTKYVRDSTWPSLLTLATSQGASMLQKSISHPILRRILNDMKNGKTSQK